MQTERNETPCTLKKFITTLCLCLMSALMKRRSAFVGIAIMITLLPKSAFPNHRRWLITSFSEVTKHWNTELKRDVHNWFMSRYELADYEVKPTSAQTIP